MLSRSCCPGLTCACLPEALSSHTRTNVRAPRATLPTVLSQRSRVSTEPRRLSLEVSRKAVLFTSRLMGLDRPCLSLMSLRYGLEGHVLLVPPTVLEAQTCVPWDWAMQPPTSETLCCLKGAQTLHWVFLGSQTPPRLPGWSPFLPDANAGARLPVTPAQELCSPPSWCSTHRCPSHSLRSLPKPHLPITFLSRHHPILPAYSSSPPSPHISHHTAAPPEEPAATRVAFTDRSCPQ